MEHTIVWDCPTCNERNFTRRDATRPTCQQCEAVYEWRSVKFASLVSHEETLDDDGNFSADAWIPDVDDPDYDKYPEVMACSQCGKWNTDCHCEEGY